MTSQEINQMTNQLVAMDLTWEAHQETLEYDSPAYWKCQDIMWALRTAIKEMSPE